MLLFLKNALNCPRTELSFDQAISTTYEYLVPQVQHPKDASLRFGTSGVTCASFQVGPVLSRMVRLTHPHVPWRLVLENGLGKPVFLSSS